MRLDTAGNVDPTFANGGVATADFGGDDDADNVTVQGTGQIFVVGTTDAGGGQTAVAAYDANGNLDTSFGTGGKFTVSAVGSGRALHVGGLLLRAFGGLEPNGQLVVGAGSQSPTATATPLRRLNVPGSGTVGQFGAVAGKKNRKLAFLDADLTKITLSIKGPGTGTAFFDGTSIDLVLTGTTAKSSVSIGGKGGNGRVRIRDVRTSGALKSVSGKNTDVTGTFFVNGSLGSASLGTLSGTLAASNSIKSVSFAGALSVANILAGANLGADAKLGGGDDTFNAASIAKLAVKGAVAGSLIEAGVNPGNGTFGDTGDTLVGGTASGIKSISIKGGTNVSTRFIAGAFPKTAKLPQKVIPTTDARFTLLT